jgi:GNAT superfamily N-acetyltransferase
MPPPVPCAVHYCRARANTLVGATPESEEDPRVFAVKVHRQLFLGRKSALVAELNGEIVGSAHGEVIHRTDYWPKTVGSISTVYVVGKFKRKGVGALLVKKVCEFFDAEGVEDVTLRYIVGNKEAEGFGKKLGFRQVIATAALGLEELISRTSRV